MEDVSPPLRLIIHLRWNMIKGASFRAALTSYFSLPMDLLGKSLYSNFLRGNFKDISNTKLNESVVTLAIIQLLDAGLQGLPILERLEEIESEIFELEQQRQQLMISDLPIKGLIPLLFFLFPAFLLLIVGPVLLQLMQMLRS